MASAPGIPDNSPAVDYANLIKWANDVKAQPKKAESSLISYGIITIVIIGLIISIYMTYKNSSSSTGGNIPGNAPANSVTSNTQPGEPRIQYVSAIPRY